MRVFGDKERITPDEIVAILRREADVMERLNSESPLSFVISVCGSMLEWGLITLPRYDSSSPHSTENERMLLHQSLGNINALADIY